MNVIGEYLDEVIDNPENAHALLKAVYQNPEVPLAVRVRVAIACLPFEVPKLAVTAQVTDQDFATLLDQRIAHYQQMELANNVKVIDAQPINGEPQRQPQVEIKPPLARTNDRRFRRF